MNNFATQTERDLWDGLCQLENEYRAACRNIGELADENARLRRKLDREPKSYKIMAWEGVDNLWIVEYDDLSRMIIRTWTDVDDVHRAESDNGRTSYSTNSESDAAFNLAENYFQLGNE